MFQLKLLLAEGGLMRGYDEHAVIIGDWMPPTPR